MLGHWVNGMIDQESDVPSIIYLYNFLQNSLQISFQLIFLFFYNFTKIKERVLSALSPNQEPTVLFLIYQNDT